ncbi:KpsF/GutQ family protein [Pirellula staleyi DSM 6068]|uniref:KpsF/GutQ family protein n=1 Tax=Pirellula staleyi (strain ATCC 27377 / DSM 6068 / ICPB 4128) TaxID=530564 RepID=D2R6F2_PIRSD|nr:KpsF/GutQ family sugar-phosphate isomerase [Pirellula staleyi]ADB15530.1 KpsF/GutQ family protein [Pirellula staleyi DSM 6068]
MHTASSSTLGPRAALDPLQLARTVLLSESDAIAGLATRLDHHFVSAVKMLLDCRGSLILSGMGKAGLIASKLTATFASTGTRSHFVHPAEAIHGDLGRIAEGDVVLMLSYSGETEEITRILPMLRDFGASIIAITGQPSSTLARAATVVLDLGRITEACPLGLAPSTSTAAMLALGDALAIVVSQSRGFSADDFARYHPGGSLGRKLATVNDVMRPLAECRVAHENERLREALVNQRRPGRRSGAILLIDDAGKLSGIFTDSDLARLLEAKRDAAIDGPLSDVMTRRPTTIQEGTSLAAACDLLAMKKISELPVIDHDGKPAGLVDITDVVLVASDDDEAPAVDGPTLLKLVAPPMPRGSSAKKK